MCVKTNLPSDEESREYIVQNTNTNYFVEASAGSGKTYSLVLRMVAMVEGNEQKGIAPVPIDQICTITFTKAAAAEFFSRFQRALSVRSVPQDHNIDDSLGPKTPTTMQRCREALDNIDSCFLGTIDAFCNMIAHELPTELGIPSDSEVISNDERLELLQKKYDEILKNPSDPNHQKALLFESLFYKPRTKFSKAIAYLGSLRNTNIVYNRSLVGIDPNNLFTQAEKDKFLRYVEGLCSDEVVFNSKAGYPRSAKYSNQVTLKTLAKKIDKSDWSKCLPTIDFALTQIKKMDGPSIAVLGTGLDQYNLYVPKEGTGNISTVQYHPEAANFFKTVENRLDDYKYAVLFDLIMSILHKTFDDLKDNGKLGFFDYIYYLTDALKNDFNGDRRIINHILKRHSHFLLDESQDTDPLQTELFFYLTGENPNKVSNWTETKPRDGSLFIVGDPKQSIYGFRNANVQAFNKIKDIFAKENKVLILTKNFRSREIIKEWFNASMNSVLQNDVEPLTHIDIPIDATKKQKEADKFDVNGQKLELYQGVYKYITPTKEDPQAVAKFIVDLVNDNSKVILVKNKKTDQNEVRNITFGDIRVVPRSTSVDGYVAAFNEYKIPVIIEASIPFEKSKTLLNVVDLVCLLKSPGDKASLFKVLYGDLFKLNDKDIIQMKIDGFNFDISNDISSISFTNQKSQKAIALLQKVYNDTKGFSFSSAMLYVLNNKDFNISTKVGVDFLEYTFYLIEKVKENEEAGLIAGVAQFKKYVEGFINGDTDDNRTVRFKDDSNRVILANLHKVKGLQAPIVILCGPEQKNSASKRRIDYSQGTAITRITGIEDKDDYSTITETHDINDEEQKIWDEYEKAERERVEYVGATRAESVLLVAEKQPSKKSQPSKSNYPNFNPWSNLLKNIDDSLKVSVPEVSAPPSNPKDIDLDNPLDLGESNEKSFVFSSPSKKAGDIKNISSNSNLDEINEDQNLGEASTLVGTMVHRLMECLVSSRDNPYSDLNDLVNQIINEYHGYEYHDIIDKVASTIVNGGYAQKNSSVSQDILSMLKKAEEVYCETPFSYKKGNEIINGIIDLIYKDENGYHIIDYKTNKVEDVHELETKEYVNQLNDYIDALKEMGVDADAHIYHIDIRQ